MSESRSDDELQGASASGSSAGPSTAPASHDTTGPLVSSSVENEHYAAAIATIARTIDQFAGCSDEEKSLLKKELAELESMSQKLIAGRIDIVLFGEIDTGKSALINALVGAEVAQVDVRGGWTKDIWSAPWKACGYCVPGLEQSQVVLVDTPGINEVQGADRAMMARDAADRADLILFVTDSDLNQLEFTALAELATSNKPIILVFNKIDNYTREQRARLRDVFRDERLKGILSSDDIIETAANPLPREYVIESADGSVRSEYRQLSPDVEALKVRIVEVLERDGKALLALNAAMYAADKSDRIAALKIRLRDDRATKLIWSSAAFKAIVVSLTPIPAADVIAGSTVDVSMVVALAAVYGISLSRVHAKQLVQAILEAAGWMVLTETLTHLAAGLFKGLTLGKGTVLVALPQGAAAGYGSYIVGQAAKYYFEHGASWGSEAPKSVVTRILDMTDKQSVVKRLQEEIKKRMRLNRHSGGGNLPADSTK